jgi:hypothetical protein
MVSRIQQAVAVLLLACCYAAMECPAAAQAQATPPSQPPLDLGVTFSTTVTEALFGTGTATLTGLKGDIYALRAGTRELPKFKKRKPIGTVYTNGLNIRPRLFSEGFPGVVDRVEWFAIVYTGKFYVAEPGKYEWALISDDGSKLDIDDHPVINNDGIHSPLRKNGSRNLSVGMHTIRISYFQGPRYTIALLLAVQAPGKKDYRIFNTDEFQLPRSPGN